jgi:hypothetical protein
MYMKQFTLLALLMFLVPLGSFAQNEDYRFFNEIESPSYTPDTITMSQPSVLFVNDTTLLAPSVYLRRAAKAQTFELILTAASVATALIGVYSYNHNIYVMEDGTVNHLESGTGYYVVAGVFGALAIVNHIISIHSTRRASESLSRFHLMSNGISIDL